MINTDGRYIYIYMFLNLVIGCFRIFKGCLLICFIDLLMDSLMDDILIMVFFMHHTIVYHIWMILPVGWFSILCLTKDYCHGWYMDDICSWMIKQDDFMDDILKYQCIMHNLKPIWDNERHINYWIIIIITHFMDDCMDDMLMILIMSLYGRSAWFIISSGGMNFNLLYGRYIFDIYWWLIDD